MRLPEEKRVRETPHSDEVTILSASEMHGRPQLRFKLSVTPSDAVYLVTVLRE